MVGWWTGFPFWESFGVCVVGGILGVMYTVPLRRALVTNPTCPIPKASPPPKCSRSARARARAAPPMRPRSPKIRPASCRRWGGTLASAGFYL
jgi:hypothetical protein